MLEKLKTDVCKANLDLVSEGLVIQTWGNASSKLYDLMKQLIDIRNRVRK
jgi:ribulose-5-phosphate 4-epimerase/fuculose-1-phosphate aldolase